MKKRFAFIISIAAVITLIFCFSPDSYTDAFNTANDPTAMHTDPSDGLHGGTDPDGTDPGGADTRRTDPDDIPGGTETSSPDPIIEEPVIVLDPGHGGIDGGAVSGGAVSGGTVSGSAVSGGAVEKEINLNVCLKLRDILKDKDVTVYMTRYEDTFVEVIDRVKFANDLDADMLLSIHCNSFKSRSESGLTIFTSYKGRTYKNLTEEIYARSIHNETVRLVEYGLKDRGIVSHIDYCLTTAGKMPSVLIELGFLSNPGDVELLLSPDFQDIVAQTLANGIMNSVHTAETTE